MRNLYINGKKLIELTKNPWISTQIKISSIRKIAEKKEEKKTICSKKIKIKRRKSQQRLLRTKICLKSGEISKVMIK